MKIRCLVDLFNDKKKISKMNHAELMDIISESMKTEKIEVK